MRTLAHVCALLGLSSAHAHAHAPLSISERGGDLGSLADMPPSSWLAFPTGIRVALGLGQPIDVQCRSGRAAYYLGHVRCRARLAACTGARVVRGLNAVLDRSAAHCGGMLLCAPLVSTPFTVPNAFTPPPFFLPQPKGIPAESHRCAGFLPLPFFLPMQILGAEEKCHQIEIELGDDMRIFAVLKLRCRWWSGQHVHRVRRFEPRLTHPEHTQGRALWARTVSLMHFWVRCCW